MRTGAERERVDELFDAEDASQEIRTLNVSFNQLITEMVESDLSLLHGRSNS